MVRKIGRGRHHVNHFYNLVIVTLIRVRDVGKTRRGVPRIGRMTGIREGENGGTATEVSNGAKNFNRRTQRKRRRDHG